MVSGYQSLKQSTALGNICFSGNFTNLHLSLSPLPAVACGKRLQNPVVCFMLLFYRLAEGSCTLQALVSFTCGRQLLLLFIGNLV
jgi:hypothetical protein